jgi:hypothetical protein
MDKKGAYPWISAVIGGLVGLLVLIIASNSISYFPYSTDGVDWAEVFGLGAGIGVLLAWLGAIVAGLMAGADEGIFAGIFAGVLSFFFGSIGGLIIGGIMGLIIVAIAPIFLGIALGAVTGIVVGIARGDIVDLSDFKDDDFLYLLMPFSTVPSAILCAIAWWLESELIANIIFVPMFAGIGYVIGKVMGETATEREKILEDTEHRITQVKRKIEETKMLGLDDPNAENNIKKASEHFRMRKYGIAKDLAEKAEKPAEEYLQKHRDATAAIQKASGIIDNGKRFGCNVRNAEDLLNKAISTIGSALERGSQEELKDAERLANEAQEVAKRIMMESKPKISIALYPEEEFRSHSWQNVKLEVSNVGAAHAMDVMVQFSKEVEVKDLRKIGKILSKGEREVLKFMLKPLDMGEVPVDITVNFRDLDGTSYTDVERFNLTVSQEVPEVKVTIRDWEFMKDVIEEVTQNRVEVKELRQDLGRRYSDKDLARILEASKIMEKMVEMSYQEAIRTDDFLDKLRSLEGYTEGLSKKVRSEINEFRRFLKEELFEYVDAEHKRDVRRFCRNLLDIWIADVLSRG